MKIRVRIPNPANRPMMREFDQGYVVPPHWRARSRQITAGTRIEAPIRSSFIIRSMGVRWSGLLSRWILRTKAIMTMATAPIGRL
jgi:hypothetical protein